MTEAEWNYCTDPHEMLEAARGKVTERRLRLFACGCCRQIWHQIAEHQCREAIKVAERFADGMADEASLRQVEVEIEVMGNGLPVHADRESYPIRFAAMRLATYPLAYDDVSNIARSIAFAASGLLRLDTGTDAAAVGRHLESERLAQSNLLRCIIGNPFKLVTIKKAWLTSNVAELARRIYDDNLFDRVPILADALEDAGCGNADILNHCRGENVHVRGCWCLDLILGKS